MYKLPSSYFHFIFRILNETSLCCYHCNTTLSGYYSFSQFQCYLSWLLYLLNKAKFVHYQIVITFFFFCYSCLSYPFLSVLLLSVHGFSFKIHLVCVLFFFLQFQSSLKTQKKNKFLLNVVNTFCQFLQQ